MTYFVRKIDLKMRPHSLFWYWFTPPIVLHPQLSCHLLLFGMSILMVRFLLLRFQMEWPSSIIIWGWVDMETKFRLREIKCHFWHWSGWYFWVCHLVTFLNRLCLQVYGFSPFNRLSFARFVSTWESFQLALIVGTYHIRINVSGLRRLKFPYCS